MIIPKKSLGQNFLIDKNIVKKIISTTKIYNQNILEIGPGFGILTDEIIKRKPKKFIIIEKDDELINLLNLKYKDYNITILKGDALKFNFNNLIDFKIISNLPYNISSKFILQSLKLNKNISEIICMIQSELADKFDFNKGKMNKYKFISQLCSNFESKINVPSSVFYPKPKVKSKVIRFVLRKKKIDIDKLDYFLKNFFINKRKKIKSNKNFKSFIDKEVMNFRYEDLDYLDILKIYHTFQFFSSQ